MCAVSQALNIPVEVDDVESRGEALRSIRHGGSLKEPAFQSEATPQVAVEIGGGEQAIPFKEFLRVLRRRIVAVVTVTVLITALGVGFSLLSTPVFDARAKVFVGQEQTEATQSLTSDIQGLQQITETVVEAVNSRVVAEGVIENLGLSISAEDFLENLEVEQVGKTQFISIGYGDSDPEQAAEVANAVAGEASERISRMGPSASALTVTVWESAVEPSTPDSPRPVRDGVLAMVVGLMLGVGLAFLLEILDDSWRSPDEVERISGLPNFSIVPEFKVRNVKTVEG